MFTERLARVRQRIRDACQRSGCDPATVTLVGVTKTVPVELVQAAIAAGLTDVGENRVQEAREKFPRLPPEIRRHLIGHLQRNKAKQAVELFDVIHSVDSEALAEELERHAAAQQKTPNVLMQVNISGEATKFGCAPDEVERLAHAMQRFAHLRWRGLMAIPPFSDSPEDARPHFRRLRELRDRLQHSAFRTPPARNAIQEPGRAHSALLLSMGMSNDFEVAIEEGADIVRIGTAIFGSRTAAS